MGGYGSTRWGWHDKKTTVEDCRQLNVGRMQLKPNVKLLVVADYDTRPYIVDVDTFETDGFLVTQCGWRVELSSTPAPNGGRRWWLHCPACNRRGGKLYAPPWMGSKLKCRNCYNLAYESQQTHDKRTAELIRNAGNFYALFQQYERLPMSDQLRVLIEQTRRFTRWKMPPTYKMLSRNE